ncbi:MAG: ribosome small subunit-dependent GTPase A, partial [Oscillospiraceae bacterium]|nr:ribosome small subunit-dependent GTPase A [Oscillospiraceae bacterium]
EFAPYANDCRFADCAHVKELGCAVIEAVERGEICQSRHASYVRLHDQLKDLREWNTKKF